MGMIYKCDRCGQDIGPDRAKVVDVRVEPNDGRLPALQQVCWACAVGHYHYPLKDNPKG